MNNRTQTPSLTNQLISHSQFFFLPNVTFPLPLFTFPSSPSLIWPFHPTLTLFLSPSPFSCYLSIYLFFLYLPFFYLSFLHLPFFHLFFISPYLSMSGFFHPFSTFLLLFLPPLSHLNFLFHSHFLPVPSPPLPHLTFTFPTIFSSSYHSSFFSSSPALSHPQSISLSLFLPFLPILTSPFPPPLPSHRSPGGSPIISRECGRRAWSNHTPSPTAS